MAADSIHSIPSRNRIYYLSLSPILSQCQNRKGKRIPQPPDFRWIWDIFQNYYFNLRCCLFAGSDNEIAFGQFGRDATIPQRQQGPSGADTAPRTHLRPGHRRPDGRTHRHLFLTHSSCSTFHTGIIHTRHMSIILTVYSSVQLFPPVNLCRCSFASNIERQIR
jgi:hypothetical protein